MKKLYISLILLFTMISIAMAQPAMMTKGSSEISTQVDSDTVCQDESDRLSVTIVTENGQTFHHPQHPEVGKICPFVDVFTTTQSYAWYQWEAVFQDTITSTSYWTDINVNMPGYIKVTVGDNYGHTGSDYIWFNVYYVPPMENPIMEIDDDFHANFSGIATENYRELQFYYRHYPDDWINIYNSPLSPGEWTYKDTINTFCDDTLLIYVTELFGFDDCQPPLMSVELMPGLLLNSKKIYDKWYLDIKTMLQGNGSYINYGFRYFVYTVDQYGQRHHLHDENGNPIILIRDAIQWEIPGPHIDPYYQCGVVRRLDDGSYKLVSLSNKIANPLLDITSTNEIEDKYTFCYPNPAQGQFTVEGDGMMHVTNVLGQEIMVKAINGKAIIELPQGLYFVKLGNKTQKIVVE